MADRVATWSGLWGIRDQARGCQEAAGVRNQILKELAGQHKADEEELISVETVRKCIRTAPKKAALGADQWRPHDWCNLPEEGVREIRDLLANVERQMKWPGQVLLNVAVFLGNQPSCPPRGRSPSPRVCTGCGAS